MPQPRIATFQRPQKKTRRGTNNDKNNTRYKTTDAYKKNCNRGPALKRRKKPKGSGRGLIQFNSRKISLCLKFGSFHNINF